MSTLWELYLSLLQIMGLMVLGLLMLAFTVAVVLAPIIALWLVIESR